MTYFNFKSEYQQLLTPEIVFQLTQIHEYKGHQPLRLNVPQKILDELAESAIAQSAIASRQINGVFSADDQLKKIAQNKASPSTGTEKAVAGYRDVLANISNGTNYDFIQPTPTTILELHKSLYKYSGCTVGGRYTDDNSAKIAESLATLCSAYEAAQQNPTLDALLLIPLFILHFLQIHPFDCGNERMSLLLMQLLLYRSGYLTGKYTSIESLISGTADSYHAALQVSLASHPYAEINSEPFVSYILGILAAAYQTFEDSIDRLTNKELSKAERVQKIIQSKQGQITKSEIMAQCPEISQITVQRALADLLKNGIITKLGGGRYTSYIWNEEN